jgi:hypothetical protein
VHGAHCGPATAVVFSANSAKGRLVRRVLEQVEMQRMRPMVDVSSLFIRDARDRADTLPGDLAVPDTERSHPPGESGITLRAPAGGPNAAPSVHPLSELDVFLAARLLRLEATCAGDEDTARLRVARTLRVGLLVAAMQSEQLPSGEETFEAALADTLRGVYGWTFGALDDSFLGGYVRPLPKRLAREILDHAEAAAALAGLAPETAALVEPLHQIARACETLALRPAGA